MRNYQSKLEEKLDDLMETPSVEVPIRDTSNGDIGVAIEMRKRKDLLEIKREFEYIGGQIRFIVGLANNSNGPLTDVKITFDIPDALKWIMHEPNYERKGDVITIPKLGRKEKKSIANF